MRRQGKAVVGARTGGTSGGAIYVVAGKDRPLVDAEVRRLLDELIEPSERATGLLDLDGRCVVAADVLDELRTVPFLSGRRVVVVRNADTFVSGNRGLLEGYFESPCRTGVLVLVVESWPANTRLARKLAETGVLLAVRQPRYPEMLSRLRGYALEAHGKKLAGDAARLLIELSGRDLCRLYGEIDKLALYAAERPAITMGEVESLVGHNRVFGAFEVIDAVLNDDLRRALRRLRVMFAADRSAEYMVVGAFAFHLRRMFRARALLEGGSRPDDIASRLGIRSNKQGFLAQLRAISLEGIGGLLARLGQMDLEIKTGRTSASLAIERFVLDMLTSDTGGAERPGGRCVR